MVHMVMLHMVMVSKWFKILARFRFCHKLFMKMPRVGEKKNKKKASFQVLCLHFQFFESFGNLVIGFSINLNFSELLLVLSNLHYPFFKTSTHYKTSAKRAVAMSLQQTYFFTFIYSQIKFYCPKVTRSWVICIKTILLHVIKTRHYLDYVTTT